MFFLEKKEESKNSQTDTDLEPKYSRPRILTIDLPDQISRNIASFGFNIKRGSLGTPIIIPNKQEFKAHHCLPNFSFPKNIHEYDIVIIDLIKSPPKKYEPNEHEKKISIGKEDSYFECAYPETLFDPRPFSAKKIQSNLAEICERGGIIIVFSDQLNEITYQIVNKTLIGNERGNSFKCNNYEFLPFNYHINNKEGHLITIDKSDFLMKSLFLKYFNNERDAHYSVIFSNF